MAIKHPFSGRTGDDNRDVGFEYRRKVGHYLRDLRDVKGLTQEELGKLVGIKPTAISAIELGRNPIPPERYKAFAEALTNTQSEVKKFALFLLEYTDPWLFALIYGEDKVVKHNLGQITDRLRNPYD